MRIFVLVAAFLCLARVAVAAGALQNDAYRLTLLEGGSVVVTHKPSGKSAPFRPDFCVVYGADDPKLRNNGKIIEPWRKGGPFNYVVPAWDGETDFFKAPGTRTALVGSRAVQRENVIEWSLPVGPPGRLKATISLPPGAEQPLLHVTFTPAVAGYYSVGYTGAPDAAPGDVDWIWQPLIWQQKRFPAQAYLTPEYQCPIPVAMTARDGVMVGVAADPRESPYRMPTFANSRFGLLARNDRGRAQPILFAPVYGGEESRMDAGHTMTFTMRLVVGAEDWYESYKSLARNLYGFGDYRQNTLCSLNETLDNLVDFVLADEYSYWYPRFKTNGYQTDAPGFGRQQSAVSALSLALVRDSRGLYDRRALPTIEYVLSRNSLMYNLKAYDVKHGMGGPVGGMEVDWAALHGMLRGQTRIFRDLIDQSARRLPARVGVEPARSRQEALETAKDHLNNLIAFYRATGEQSYLTRARRVADDYVEWRIARPAIDFRDAGSSFWHEVSPTWDVLLELYDETGDERYRRAATEGFKEFCGFVYLQPRIPDEEIVVNEGGVVRGMKALEEKVPAWRVSANGLTAECAGTAHSHRGIFMAPYAAYAQRLAFETGDDFFRDVARAAVVGRYANYPSYAYRHHHTTIIEKPDYPLRPFEELTYTSEHYNHPTPMCTYLVDYLVSEALARSKGQIRFPSRYTSTGAYFKNKVYGDRPGTFYGESGVWLWLPKALLKADDVQLNYVAGHGNAKLYVALMNQSKRSVESIIRLNPERVALGQPKRVQVMQEGAEQSQTLTVDGTMRVSVAPGGLTAFIIDDVEVRTELHEVQQQEPRHNWTHDSTSTSFGIVSTTAIALGERLTTGYVWLEATPEQVKQAVVHYSIGEQRHSAVDTEHPFEFTFPIDAGAKAVDVRVEAEASDGTRRWSTPLKLSAGPLPP